MPTPAPSILVLNGGSSSIRHAVLRADDALTPVCSGTLAGVGEVVQWLRQRGDADHLVAVGHRIVHGLQHVDAQRLTPALLADLRRIEPVDPDHLPVEIRLVEAAHAALPGLPQFASFDTRFHRDLPRVASVLPIPRRFEAQGLRRYGFHGLSYEYLMEELARLAGPAAADGRVILAHLGGGASLAAVHAGRCIDTTMSFTPTAGLVMGTRSGDLDPGLGPYLERTAGMTSARFLKMVSHESGLLGVSETSADMRALQAAEATDPRAAEAIALFCYQARKAIGAFAAALGGLDTLVFAGGIGENAPEIRARICDGLGHLGVAIDAERNGRAPGVVSAASGRVEVRVIATNEARMIARDVRDLLAIQESTP